jgi:hypothetical protein
VSKSVKVQKYRAYPEFESLANKHFGDIMNKEEKGII